MYTTIVIASVCRFESLMRTICGSVVVQRNRVGMYMAILRVIHSFWGCRGMTYEKTGQVSDSEQKWKGMTRIMKGRAMTQHRSKGM